MTKARAIIADFQHGSLHVEQEVLKDLATVESLDVHNESELWGRIGTAAATRAKALGMDVIFYDPYKPDGYDKAIGARRVETFDELLDQAFVLSCHCPLTPETHHIVNAAAIEKMPRGSYLINTS